MPAYKLRTLGPVVVQALVQIKLEGNDNWICDWRLADRIRGKFKVMCKDDDVRRVASDLAKMGEIRKYPRKSMYRWRD